MACWKRSECGAGAVECRDVINNIEKVYNKLEKKSDGSLLDDIYYASKKFTGDVSLLFLQVIFSFFLYALFFCFKKRGKSRWYLISSLLCVHINIVLGFGIMFKYQEQQYPVGVIKTDKVSVFNGPNNHYHEIGSLYYADQVKIRENRSDWYKIYHNNLQGMV